MSPGLLHSSPFLCCIFFLKKRQGKIKNKLILAKFRSETTSISSLLAFFFFLNKKPKLLVVCFFFFSVRPLGLQDLSSPTRDWTQAPTEQVLSPDQWTTREFPRLAFYWKTISFFIEVQFLHNEWPHSLSFIYFWLCWVFVAACELFPNCGKWGLLFVVVHRILTVAASFVAECRLQGMQASVVVVFGLSSCGAWA